MGVTKKGGNGVSVLGAGGRVYYYAHLAAFAKNLRVGSAVPKGTLLGYVGTSGNAAGTPAHLHFGVYDFTVAIDPLTLMQDAPSSRRLY
jgi:murein DD-endopeptidase MepM/ murein hydrolase activator NlpD